LPGDWADSVTDISPVSADPDQHLSWFSGTCVGTTEAVSPGLRDWQCDAVVVVVAVVVVGSGCCPDSAASGSSSLFWRADVSPAPASDS